MDFGFWISDFTPNPPSVHSAIYLSVSFWISVHSAIRNPQSAIHSILVSVYVWD
ncbi:MAG: hypothetical protein QME81_08630 [bacterium]|nr:hypothetical protein [bacterium]